MEARNPMMDESLELTRRMLACGQEGAWDKVVELERHRRPRLEQALARPGSVDEATASSIRDILALDRQLIALGARYRDEVGEALSNAQRGTKATRAYRGVDS